MGSNRSRWPDPPPRSAATPASTPPSIPPTPPGLGQGSGRATRTTLAPFRAHGRKPVRITTIVTHLQAGWQHQAAVENIGLGGARIQVDRALAPGDVVTLSITAPTLWDPLVLRAHVAWVAGARPYAAGLAFEHKAADAVFALYELIVTLGYE